MRCELRQTHIKHRYIVLPTWSVLLVDKLYELSLGRAKDLLGLFARYSALIPAAGHEECGLRGEELHHVDGAGPVAGPVGAQHGLGLITEDGQQAAAAGLTVEVWMQGINIRYVWKGPTGHSRDNISQFRKNW